MKLVMILQLATLVAAVAAIFAPESPGGNPDSKLVREINDQGYRVQLDLSSQVLRLAVPEDKGWAHGLSAEQEEAAISPTLAGIADERFISASVLAQKAKQFDDGLYAAVEFAAQQGAGKFAGKASLLSSVVHSLIQGAGEPPTPAVATVFAAGKFGNLEMDLSAATQESVQEMTNKFLQDELRSKPIGFYSWNDGLGMIFRQDRMLQTELRDKLGTTAIVKALHGDKIARATYEDYLHLISQLTNPLAYPDLREPLIAADRGNMIIPENNIYFFPPSRAHETDLIKKLYGNRPIPEGFSLIDEMIKRIQEGRLPLHPTADSGWYDYQTWALEPLVIPDKMPEAGHLELDASYRKQLLELFKGILALTRETHIKQLEVPKAGAAMQPIMIHIVPELSVEPLATYYFRRASSYSFIRKILEATFGAPALEKMHRLTATGPVPSTLAEELLIMENLFYGAHVTACRQLGMNPTTSPSIGTDRVKDTAAAFAEWQRKLADDTDVGQDARMMVPLFYDLNRRKTKVWVFMGWAVKPVAVSFAAPPKATIFDKKGKRVTIFGPKLAFNSSRYNLAYPVTAEVYVTQVLNRNEVREHCDRYKSRSAILANLK
ncbi:MAG: hypothetical protein ABFD82_10590 [Syntrophaceae bacterium]